MRTRYSLIRPGSAIHGRNVGIAVFVPSIPSPCFSLSFLPSSRFRSHETDRACSRAPKIEALIISRATENSEQGDINQLSRLTPSLIFSISKYYFGIRESYLDGIAWFPLEQNLVIVKIRRPETKDESRRERKCDTLCVNAKNDSCAGNFVDLLKARTND